jgi:hypothetical protein
MHLSLKKEGLHSKHDHRSDGEGKNAKDDVRQTAGKWPLRASITG